MINMNEETYTKKLEEKINGNYVLEKNPYNICLEFLAINRKLLNLRYFILQKGWIIIGL